MSDTRTRVSRAELLVKDLDRMAAFYGDIVGLDQDDGVFRDPTTGSVILKLTSSPDAQRPVRPRAGLFHLAFLYSDRTGLSDAIRGVLDTGMRAHGFSNHGVSEAFYLSDPEGNGVELYHDRPESEWPRKGSRIAMMSEPIELEPWLAGTNPSPGAGGITLGHVHLKVSSLEDSEQFYRGLLGMDITQDDYTGAYFLSYDGYHHHVAINVWSGEGLGLRKADETGLISFSFRANDAREGALDPNGIAVSFTDLDAQTTGN
jgi:catechol 2,3-dioxygenase